MGEGQSKQVLARRLSSNFVKRKKEQGTRLKDSKVKEVKDVYEFIEKLGSFVFSFYLSILFFYSFF